MILTLNNFGPIKKESTIDVSGKLNIFCGPNGTGKTYVSYLLYGLGQINWMYKLTDKIEYENSFPLDLTIKDKEIINEILSKRPSTETPDYFTKKKIVKFNNRIAQDIIQNLFTLSHQDNFISLFGISKSDTERLFSQMKIKFELLSDVKVNRQENTSFVSTQNARYIISSDNDDIIIFYNRNKDSKKYYTYLDRPIQAFIIRHLLHLYIPFKTSILPVERNSIYTFSKELSLKRQNVVDNIHDIINQNKKEDPLDLIKRRTTRYPQAIRDGLEISEDLYNFSKQESIYKDLAFEIEKEILEGKISVTKDNEIQFVSSRGTKSSYVPIQTSASLVKSLAGMIFYLKHLAKEGDMLIIDEPEMNLHPDLQVKVARVFAKVIQAGLRLTVSTHSDYIIRELNNLIMLSSEKEEVKEVAKSLGYKKDEYIRPEDIRVNFFHFATKTMAKVTPLKVTQEGFDVKTIDETINALNERTDELYMALNPLD